MLVDDFTSISRAFCFGGLGGGGVQQNRAERETEVMNFEAAGLLITGTGFLRVQADVDHTREQQSLQVIGPHVQPVHSHLLLLLEV